MWSNWWRRRRAQQLVWDRSLQHSLIAQLPTLAALPPSDHQRLAELTAEFLVDKRFFGADGLTLEPRHLITIATLDFAFVMLAESALSFLGIGIQPPEITWGLMVAQGRNYLNTAWWLAFFPGLMIMLTTLSLNLLSSWLRIATDPAQRWRLESDHD